MMSFRLWQRWLVVVSSLIIVFGLSLALLNQTALFDLTFNHRVDRAFWPDGSPTPAVKAFQQWIYGVLGATVTGWGIAFAFIAAGPFARKEAWSWYCLALSVAIWFVIDSAISLAFGIGVNIVFNTALLVAMGLPLILVRRHFREPGPHGQASDP